MLKKWVALLAKEFKYSFYSLSGLVFIVLFLSVLGSLLWLVPGEYNIAENGYASLASFFRLAPFLFLFLIPALSMRSLAEEKRLRTLLLLKSRPVCLSAILSAKIAAIFLIVVLALIPTIIYVVVIYNYGNPVGNVDLGEIAASYIGLLFLVGAFVCISVFASGLTSNQVLALILGLLFSAFFYFGFDLSASLFPAGKTRIFISELSFLSHYRSIQKGLIETKDIFYFLAIGSLFYVFTLKTLGESFVSRTMKIGGTLFFLFLLFHLTFNCRFDWTKDKKYSLSPLFYKLLKEAEAPVMIDVYLDGNLNPGFKQLQQAAVSLLDDIHRISSGNVVYEIINPYRKGTEFREELTEKGMKGIAVNERLPDGTISQNILFPYFLLHYKDSETAVPLLINRQGKSGAENLNASIENMEYALAHTLRLLFRTESRRLLFLEGQGELTEDYLQDIWDYLSSEFSIDCGTLPKTSTELNAYDLLVIAGAQTPFSEQDKFILDQYLMQGGSLLWFIDGVAIHSYEELVQTGATVSMSKSLNLDDLFFTYGLRINPVLLQDLQSLSIPVAVKDSSGDTHFAEKSWYYSPLLSPNDKQEITKGLPFIKTEFASVVSFVGNNPAANRREILLTSSSHAHTEAVPSKISLDETVRQLDKNYFNESYLPVAVAISGIFQSCFRNRTLPFLDSRTFLAESEPAKIVVVASENVIANELIQNEKEITPLPLGYDRYSRVQFGNKEFIMNVVNYLTDNEGLSNLRNKSLQLRLLNKQKLQQEHSYLFFWNLLFPPALIFIFWSILLTMRTRKYKKSSMTNDE